MPVATERSEREFQFLMTHSLWRRRL